MIGNATAPTAVPEAAIPTTKARFLRKYVPRTERQGENMAPSAICESIRGQSTVTLERDERTCPHAERMTKKDFDKAFADREAAHSDDPEDRAER